MPGLPAWSCRVPAGPAFSIQMQAAQKLQHAGKMSWIRLNAHLDGSGIGPVPRGAAARPEHLLDATPYERPRSGRLGDGVRSAPCRLFERHLGSCERDQQPGPERQSGHHHAGLLHVEGRESVLYVKTKYPEVTLTNAPPYGSGSTGPPELEQFFKLGLLDLDVIVAINIYSNHTLSRYATAIDQYADRLAGKRIWVTETGSSNPDNHISWVRSLSTHRQHRPSRDDLLVLDVGRRFTTRR